MQNPPTAGSRGAGQLGGDSAPYTRNSTAAQTAVSARRYPHPESILARHWFRDGEIVGGAA